MRKFKFIIPIRGNNILRDNLMAKIVKNISWQNPPIPSKVWEAKKF